MDALSTRPPSTEPAKVGQNIFLRVIWAGVVVSFLFLVMRLTARYKTFKRLYFDDGFVIFSWFLALFTAIIWQIVARFMYQFMAITSGQLWPPPTNFVNDTERYYKGSVVVLIFFYTSLWAVKISFLFFFKRLGQNVRWQKILWWCVLAFTVATYFVCIGDIQYSCLAAPLGEIISHCSSDRDVNFQLVTLKFNAAIDVLTDVMILSIPTSLLWKVKISLRRKLALMGIFSLVIITMVFAIVRVAVISSESRQPDTSWSYMWSCIEQVIAIIVACLASFRTLFKQPDSRPQPLKHIPPSHNARNLFLRSNKRIRSVCQWLPITDLTGLSTEHSTHIRNDDPEEGANIAKNSSTEHVVPLNSVYVKQEIEFHETPR